MNNEDKKIKEELIELIGCMHDADPRKERWLSWLEKQQAMNHEETLDLLRMEYSKGRYDAITKTIEWLDEHLLEYWGQQNSDPSEFFIEFKKAMEGMTYEERERQVCIECRENVKCPYTSRNLEYKCQNLSDTMYGWELGYMDAIDKACKWLKYNFNMPDDFESHLKKAMEK